jgi:hypothetical protein
MLNTVSILTTLFVSQYHSAALIGGQEGSWTGNTENHNDLILHKALLFKTSKGRVTTSPDNNIAHTSIKCTQRNLFRMPREIMETGCKKKV